MPDELQPSINISSKLFSVVPTSFFHGTNNKLFKLTLFPFKVENRSLIDNYFFNDGGIRCSKNILFKYSI